MVIGCTGWEAGIRTPITWSRERCTDSVPLRFVLFSSGFHLTCFRPLRSVSVRFRAKFSLCLTSPTTRLCTTSARCCRAVSKPNHVVLNAQTIRNLPRVHKTMSTFTSHADISCEDSFARVLAATAVIRVGVRSGRRRPSASRRSERHLGKLARRREHTRQWHSGMCQLSSSLKHSRQFFSPAAKLSTTVNGTVRLPAGSAIKRKRLPSGATSLPTLSKGGGTANNRRGVPRP